MSGVRARARAELTAEIKRIAREHLARDGAAGLSLRAVARELGMVSSAVYRYFPSRDELLTALIIDAYDAFGAAAERADAAVDRSDFHGRWRAVGWAAYHWSERHPAEYALIFGSPVPGYEAPTDTIDPANRFSAVLLGILIDADAAGVPSPTRPPLSPAVEADVEGLRLRGDIPVETARLAAGLRAWSSLIGMISFIRFGHLHNVVSDCDAFFGDALERLGHEVIGAPGTASRRRNVGKA